ncbi:MAG: DUF1569 domain-containing protein [Acidobacteriaceae bacterium]
MGTLLREVDRKTLAERLGHLRPETRAQWGTMDAPRMLRHLADALDAGLGRLTVAPRGPAAFRYFPLKHLAVYVVPMPKSAKAPPELLAAEPGDFEANHRRILEAMKVAALPGSGSEPEHFLLGRLSAAQWNRLHWKHIDHHLRQFGC